GKQHRRDLSIRDQNREGKENCQKDSFFHSSGNRIPTSRIEDVTTGQPAKAEPSAAENSVFFDGLHHVDRAGRLEAAHRRQPGRNESLVEAKKKDSGRAHRGLTTRSPQHAGELE